MGKDFSELRLAKTRCERLGSSCRLRFKIVALTIQFLTNSRANYEISDGVRAESLALIKRCLRFQWRSNDFRITFVGFVALILLCLLIETSFARTLFYFGWHNGFKHFYIFSQNLHPRITRIRNNRGGHVNQQWNDEVSLRVPASLEMNLSCWAPT
uniref:Uncharacterized protein n=1 Tax=Glossina austeni TaxID=7395 RepID=A0A1A9VPM9_GLOAU